ncbi:MAG TPA: HEAT repeat domain-containing protein [Planctomycetota bacterium]|nr:HEAT repeat domain-containing protein [Planctomycetota bacterium]
MRWTLALLLLASAAFSQGMPPASRVDSWKSPHNQKRLRLDWNVPPEYKPTKLPDGSELPPKAPAPFVLYVFDNPTKESAKLDEKVFADTRFALACRPVKLVKVRPSQAIDLKYLAQAQGIKDPTLVFIDRDFKVQAVLNSLNEFTDSKVLGEMEKLVADAYDGKLGPYLGRYVKLLQDAEKLWASEMKMDQLREKAAKADPGKSKEYDAEADAIEAELTPAMEALADEEIRIQDSIAIRAEKAEELPTTVGSGKNRRKLTPQEMEALKAFQEFKRDTNPVVRAAAVEDLGSIDSAVMVEAILLAANDVDGRVTEAAGQALGRMKSDESVEAMLAGLSSGNSKSKLAAALGFASIKRPCADAARQIAGMVSGGNDELRRAAVRALRNLKDPSTVDTLIRILDDKEVAVAVLAAEALGDIRAAAANPALLARINAPDWALQKAAVEALGKIRAKESIGPLVEMFQKEQGLVDEVVQKALVAITGQDFLFNREGWKKWWDKYGSGFKVPTELEIADMKKKAENALKGYHNPNKKKYHTIETLSRKMVFVIDISGSMRDSIVLPPNAPQEVVDEFPDRCKMEIAKKALIDLLATIDGSVYFNIITFAGEVKPWQEGLVSGSMRTSAIKYVSKLKAMEPPRGGGGGRARAGGGGGGSSGEELKTDSWAALMSAFGLQDEAVPNWKARSDADTIFFVTDGVPTKGKVTDVPKLIDQITEMNRSKGVVIHVITFDKEEGKKLAPLAERNGGQCVVRGWSGDEK